MAPSIGKLWAGKVYGTNTGNLFAEFNSLDGKINGVLRVSDDRFGVSAGTFDGTSINFNGTPSQAPEGVETGRLLVQGALTPEGQLRGQWSSTIGTGGTFVLLPHDIAAKQEPLPGQPPERMHSVSRTVGAIRLYAEDVRELIAFVARDFTQGRATRPSQQALPRQPP
jgi:hypothetical protein